jgi:hypothetical protein
VESSESGILVYIFIGVCYPGRYIWEYLIVCTGAFLYAPYSFLLISNKFLMGGGGFIGTKMELGYRLDVISQGPKNSRFPGPNPLPLALVMYLHASKTLYPPYKA